MFLFIAAPEGFSIRGGMQNALFEPNGSEKDSGLGRVIVYFLRYGRI
jgi:hypothetical protein